MDKIRSAVYNASNEAEIHLLKGSVFEGRQIASQAGYETGCHISLFML